MCPATQRSPYSDVSGIEAASSAVVATRFPLSKRESVTNSSLQQCRLVHTNDSILAAFSSACFNFSRSSAPSTLDSRISSS